MRSSFETRIREALKVSIAAVAVLGAAAMLFYGAFHREKPPTEELVTPLRLDLLDLWVQPSGHIWAVGHQGRILHSADHGSTWEFQDSTVRTALSGVLFLDDRTGVAVGYDGVILRTTDGGQTWTPAESGVDLYLTTVRARPDGVLFVVGEFGTILASDDRGATWRVVTSEKFDFIINDVDFSPSGTGWAVGELGKSLWSPDGGESWSPRLISEKFALSETTMFSVDVLSDSEIWVSALESTLLHSVDGGKAWSETVAPCENETQLLRVRFAGPRGYAVGKRCAVVTADGGKSWHLSALNSPVRFSWLYGLFVTPDRVWAAGYREDLFRAGADDAGWTRVTVDRTKRTGEGFGVQLVPAAMTAQSAGKSIAERNS